eukprot:2717835-Amphidinium_carterae.1
MLKLDAVVKDSSGRERPGQLSTKATVVREIITSKIPFFWNYLKQITSFKCFRVHHITIAMVKYNFNYSPVLQLWFFIQ